MRGKRWRKRKKRRKNVTKQEKIVCTDTHRNGKIRGYSTCLRFNYFRFLLRVGYNGRIQLAIFTLSEDFSDDGATGSVAFQ